MEMSVGGSHSTAEAETERITRTVECQASGTKREGYHRVEKESADIIRNPAEVDRESLRNFYCGLSKRSQELRFLSAERPDDAFVESMYNSPEHIQQVSMVVIRRLGDHTHVVDYGSYSREMGVHANIEVAIRNDVLKNSIAAQLLERLSSQGTRIGIQHFTAIPHSTNTDMLRVFHQFGFKMKENAGHGYIVVEKWV